MILIRNRKQALIHDALTYWNRIRGNRSMPSRSDLDPLDIPRLLPYVMLVDVLRDPLDFRYRLIGSGNDQIMRDNFRGKRLSEIAGKGSGSEIWNHYAQVVSTCEPLRSEIVYVGSNRRVSRIEHCLMPLSADGDQVDMIFTVLDIEWT